MKRKTKVVINVILIAAMTAGMNGAMAIDSYAAGDFPILNAGGTASFIEADGPSVTPVVIDSGVTITDSDSPNFSGAVITIGNDQSGDLLAFADQNGITGSYNSGTGTMTLSGSASRADYQTALRSVTYQNVSDTPDPTSRIITFKITDESGNFSTASSTVTVTSTNDTPVNSVPGSQTVTQNNTLIFDATSGNQISVSDADAGAGSVQVTLAASNGLISLGSVSGLSFIVGSGTGDGTMTFAGTMADINSALNGIGFAPTSGYNGPASIQITTNDLGLSGPGGSKTDTDTVSIAVVPSLIVSGVSASTANGSYKIGDAVILTVTFDGTVTVLAGTPRLLLETGSVDRSANYFSGSNTDTLCFYYTVQAGDQSMDLDYQSTGALSANGATIQGTSGANTVLTLPAPGSPNSLGGQKNIVIDGIAPTVTSVGVPSPATYTTGQALDFTVTFDELVTVNTAGGTPRILITMDSGTDYAGYLSGSGTNTLTFRYTCKAGDRDTNGIALAGAIDLNGANIRDSAGNAAVPTLSGVPGTGGILLNTGTAPPDSASSHSSGNSSTGSNYQISNQDHSITVTSNGTSFDAGIKGADLLKVKNGADEPLKIVCGSTTYYVPFSVFGTIAADTTLTVRIKPVSDETNKSVNAKLASMGCKQLMDRPTEFSLSLNGTEIKDFKGIYTERTFSLAGAVDTDNTTAVWINEEGNICFIPSTFRTENGVTTVTIRSPHNSFYTVVQSERTFDDIKGHWAEADVEHLAGKLIADGISETEYAPDKAVTRAEFAALVIRSLGLSANGGSNPFSDLKSESWYTQEVITAYNSGLITGFSDDTFRANQKITREQMAVMIARAVKFAGKDAAAADGSLDRFGDRENISDWAEQSAAQVVEAGIMKGTGGNRFLPGSYATRAQTAAILNRMLEQVGFID